MDPLFPALPADLTKMSTDDLQAALAAHQEVVRKIQADDADVLGDRGADEVLADLKSGAEQIKAMKAELAARDEAIAAYEAEVADIAADVLADESADAAALEASADDEDGDGDGDEDGADASDLAADTASPAASADETPDALAADSDTPAADAAETPDEVVASAPKPRRVERPIPARSTGRHAPRVVVNEPKVGSLVASAGIRGVEPGQPLDRLGLANALLETHRVTNAALGSRVEVVVASASWEAPEERRLVDGDHEGNIEKIRAVMPAFMDREELTASGGLCAPLTPIYDLPLLATQDRPVRDSLPTFQADRGGITFPTPLTLADVADAVTYVTASEDEQGGTFATKSCLEIDCDPFLEAEVAAIAACVTWGNMGARAWPERVANVADLTAAYHARVAETALLDAFGDPSLATVTTDAQVYGAVATIFQGIAKAAAAYRSRNRMRRETVLQVYLPQWLPDALVADLAVSQFDRFHAIGEINRILGNANVSPVYYADTETGDGQIFGTQEAGILDDFPTTVVWYLFAPGTWLFLDMGRLDLGIVRDSTLNATNDFQTFYESFEGVAKTGVESMKVTSTICVNGSTSGPDTIISC